MKQIRIHGRGGQGVVTAAELVAIAAFEDGNFAQAFPSFGVERTGAPVESFARIDNKPIRIREHILNPDILIVQDASLLTDIDVTKGCTADTIAVINSSKSKDELNIDLPKENVFVIDASKVAIDIFGKNLMNTVILGGFAKITPLVSLDGLKKAIKQKFEAKGKDIIDKNNKAIAAAYDL